MKKFMDDDFLLTTPTAIHLFNEYASMKKIPIIDYHCHIDPKEIWEDRLFDNITQVWLEKDHYKWRQMRSNGVDEKYITGEASDFEKFEKWAETMPKLIGNPLYHWSHYELKYYFGYEGNLNPGTCKEVWDHVNKLLGLREYSVRNLIRKSNVKMICTTDDPIDSLEYHKLLKNDKSFEVEILPAFRPDKACNVEKADYKEYIKKLASVSGMEINGYADLKKAIIKRMDYFDECSCHLSDHALEYVMYEPATDDEVDEIMTKVLEGKKITKTEENKYKTSFLIFLAKEYNKRGWVMQLHYGCKRDNNALMFEKLGPDSGYDCINNYAPSAQMADFFNALSVNDEIPKTIIYSLNPNDNAVIGTIIGCFQESGIRNKIQQGSAWWFNDHYVGMSEQMRSFANLSCFGNFVGMLTDSRSFLSYTRHDYFRRILCELIGGMVERGEYPNEEKQLAEIIKGISYNNANEYFNFSLEKI